MSDRVGRIADKVAADWGARAAYATLEGDCARRGDAPRLEAADPDPRRRGHRGTLMKLIAALEDDDDVQTVTANFEMSDAVMERLAS